MLKTSSILNFRKTVLLVAILFLMVMALSILSIQIDKIGFYELKREEVERNSYKIEAITLGSSQSRAIHFDSLNMKGIHFNDDSGTIREALFKIKSLIDKLPNLKYVFIPIDSSYLEIDNLKYRNIAIRNSLNDTFENYETLKVRLLDNILFYESLKYKLFENISMGKQLKSKDGLRYGYNKEFYSMEKLKEFAYKSIKDTKKHIYSSQKNNNKVSFDNFIRLKELAKFTNKHKIKLILFSPPLTNFYIGKYNEEYESSLNNHKFISKMKIITNDYKNTFYFNEIEFFNKSSNKQLNIYFQDNTHLNEYGASYFSKYFIKLLIEE